jgi:hypothetical protein
VGILIGAGAGEDSRQGTGTGASSATQWEQVAASSQQRWDAPRRAQSKGTGSLTSGPAGEKIYLKLQTDPTLIWSISYVPKLQNLK